MENVLPLKNKVLQDTHLTPLTEIYENNLYLLTISSQNECGSYFMSFWSH